MRSQPVACRADVCRVVSATGTLDGFAPKRRVSAEGFSRRTSTAQPVARPLVALVSPVRRASSPTTPLHSTYAPVRIVFGQEMERVLREHVESGKTAKLAVGKKRKPS